MVGTNKLALLPALALLFLLAAQAGTAHRLLSEDAPDAATASSRGGNAARCANPISVHTIQQGDTPRGVVTAAYPTSRVPWRKLWALIRSCNKPSGASAASLGNGNPANKPLLRPDATLNIPAIPSSLTDKFGDKPEHQKALKALCGCTADITVTTASSWLEIITANYPGLPLAEFAANLLNMCNRGAEFVEGTGRRTLAAGQTLRGICTTIEGKSFSDFLNDARQKKDKVVAELAASEATGPVAPPNAAAAAAAAVADEVSTAQTTCTINTATSTAPVRNVDLANVCPVYTNGCSGPSDTLSYQAKLTPCCQQHDWCYSCAYRVGWTGDGGRYNCDYLFWDNLYRSCDFHYPSDFLNRGSCKTTADAMYASVRAGGGSAFNNNDACPGESWKLPSATFCFNPVYQLGGVVSYVRPGNGQQWGAWTNLAACPSGWVNAFSLRVEPNLGWSRDDTALNAVRVRCSGRDGVQTATDLIPGGLGGGNFGSWAEYVSCPAGRHVTAIRMQVEGSQGASDDTAANNLQLRCSDGTTVLAHSSSSWGNWGGWSGWVGCPTNTAVCAFRIKIEQSGAADCTSLNDFEVACCAKD